MTLLYIRAKNRASEHVSTKVMSMLCDDYQVRKFTWFKHIHCSPFKIVQDPAPIHGFSVMSSLSAVVDARIQSFDCLSEYLRSLCRHPVVGSVMNIRGRISASPAQACQLG